MRTSTYVTGVNLYNFADMALTGHDGHCGHGNILKHDMGYIRNIETLQMAEHDTHSYQGLIFAYECKTALNDYTKRILHTNKN
jgi:hypothetical protein